MHIKAENLGIPKHPFIPRSKSMGAMTLQNKANFFWGHPVDLAFYNVKPKDWYFVLDGSRASFLVPSYSPFKSQG